MRDDVAEYLRERIAGRREEAFEEIAHHKVHALVAGCREYLHLAERAAEVADAAAFDLFKAQASVERSVRAFVDRLAREIERALGIRFEGARFDPQVEEPAHPDVCLSPTFDTHFELLWFLIPMPVFRPLVRWHFLRRIPWEVEKNLSRVAGQWADALGASIDVLYRDATAFLEREVGTIAALVGEAEAGNRGEEIRAAFAELSDLESAVS
jgi:hypothetical protein